MDREIARRRPAVVTDVRPIETRPVAGRIVVRAASRGQLSAEVSRMYKSGQIERDYRTARQGDIWVAEVVPRAPRPRWLRPALWLAGGLMLAGLGLWVVKLLVTAVAALLAVLLPYLLGFLAVVAVVAIVGLLAGSGGGKTINIKM